MAADSGRRLAFLTIFNKNRPGGTVVADSYTMAIFDLDKGTYGTYTDYDMPPGSMEPDAQRKLSFADGNPMELTLSITPTRTPAVVGASTYNGRITCYGQPDTFSYFQTGMVMEGTLRWAGLQEQVYGDAGHINHQWFPLYAGGGGGGTGGDPRAMAHIWHTITLDNGMDVGIWQQFDRTNRNAPVPFAGATTLSSEPGSVPEFVADIDMRTSSYVRWPESVRTLLRPLAAGRYMPATHPHVEPARSPSDRRTAGPAPAHSLPIEYMEGPYRYVGTMGGQAVAGFAIFERALALYRDWELVDVLSCTVANLGSEAETSNLTEPIDTLRTLVSEGRRADAREYLTSTLRPELDRLPADLGLSAISNDLAVALTD